MTNKKTDDIPDDFDWSVTTFEGARREQLRRWAALPLEDIVRALEEMDDLVQLFHQPRESRQGPMAGV